MLQFTKLRLSGFKSFVDSAELLVEAGLTGVVGPNGCGKSNLVEALKWVMGETSAKQMRGEGMDDVIFGGTDKRPARNIAEVTVHLDNTTRTAPALFNNFAELEVTRRIERGTGSLYKVNGKEVRARDVQLLFADAASGARSTALVSQGRVSVLINAKPTERRALLEEAAGISGLHSRRHEAELRLHGAETNLERLEDVLGALDTQLQNLKRQARQAARYRGLSEQIRRTEAMVLHQAWVTAIRGQEEAKTRLATVETRVVQLTGQAAAAATAQAEAADGLPALRQAEAEAAARLQRLILAREQLDSESGRIAAARREAESRLTQIAADSTREDSRTADAAEALARLERERQELETARTGEGDLTAAATARLRDIGAKVNTVEADLGRLTEQVAAAEARRAASVRRIEELAARQHRLALRLTEQEANRASIAADLVPPDTVEEARQRLNTASTAVEQARDTLDAAGHARHAAETAMSASRDSLSRESAARAKLAAEAAALEDVLAEGVGGDWPAVIDAVSVTPGAEAALAAALGDDLLAATDAGAPRRWTLLPAASSPPLPGDAAPFDRLVSVPSALQRRLTQIGWVEDADTGERLWPSLLPGQRLVSRDGDLWRWDGFRSTSGVPSSAATRLRQRNRLKALRDEEAQAEAHLARAAGQAEAARTAALTATADEHHARDRLRAAEAELTAARDALAALTRKAAAVDSRLAALDESLTTLRVDRDEAEASLADARASQMELEDPAQGRLRMADLRAEAAMLRADLVEARSAYDRLVRDADTRRQRLEAILGEAVSWRQRFEAARGQRDELTQRREQAAARLQRLAARPLEIEGQRRALLDQTAAAEARRRDTADHLAQAETRLRDADRALKEAEHALALAREERVRCEAQVGQGQQTCRSVAMRINERLNCTPEALPAEWPEGESVPADSETRLERLLRERENMGPVNLRAEQEAAELEQQTGTLQSEREDLIAAVARLRQGIAEINREGRERLMASFEAVDRHFRDLFVRLFGGGRAHLSLTESNDPLQAGLEIMASPPGKRLQVLSLLSGGEQALTAVALLFAVFLTNPAPVCVLDEVDAPLDDSNVDRFCSLLKEIAHISATRFLIVTHHRTTMARMDRLFGVTMGERGVSQLVSVDLRSADALLET